MTTKIPLIALPVTPNASILRSLEITSSVGASNGGNSPGSIDSSATSADNLEPVPNPRKQSVNKVHRDRFTGNCYSYGLRNISTALDQYAAQKSVKCVSTKPLAITVNYSEGYSMVLAKGKPKKTPHQVARELLTRVLKQLDPDVRMVTRVERSQGRLHSHSLVAIKASLTKLEVREHIQTKMNKYLNDSAGTRSNAVVVASDYYDRRTLAYMDQNAIDGLEMDIKQGNVAGWVEDRKGPRLIGYKRKKSLDVGWADYFTKHKLVFPAFEDSLNWSVDSKTKKSAAEIATLNYQKRSR